MKYSGRCSSRVSVPLNGLGVKAYCGHILSPISFEKIWSHICVKKTSKDLLFVATSFEENVNSHTSRKRLSLFNVQIKESTCLFMYVCVRRVLVHG